METFNVFWDCDGTLLAYDKNETPSPSQDRELRPNASDVIQMLEHVGVKNYIWSRAGKENAKNVARRLNLPEDRAMEKPEIQSPEELDGVDVKPSLVIDDNPDETVLVYPHILVPSYKGGDDNFLLDIISKIRQHYDAVRGDDLNEVRVKFKRKKRTPSKVKAQRRKYYRKHRAYYKRYKKRWKKTPRAKRAQRLRKRLSKRFGKKLKRYRMQVRVESTSL